MEEFGRKDCVASIRPALSNSKKIRKQIGVVALIVVTIFLCTFFAWWFYVGLRRMKSSASAIYEHWMGDMLDRNLRKRAGSGALNCGTVSIHGDPRAANSCALAAIESGRSFYVRYDLQGLDSRIALGITARTTTEAYLLEYDSWGWSNEGLKPSETLIEGNHILLTPCPKPVRLREVPDGQLSCL